MPAGAVGEFFPIVGIAVFLSAHGRFLGLLSLVAMAAVAGLFALLARVRLPVRFTAIARAGEHATSQITLRITIVLLFALLVVASDFGLDVVLGAFLAGIVLRRWAPGDGESLESKLDAVGYGFFIPIFFVSSGMSLDIDSIAEAPLRLAVFFALLLAVRGLPALLLYRRDLDLSERVQMTLLTATALPLLVALAQIGLDSGHMLPENAAALVGAGVLSVMVFPGVAVAVNRRSLKKAGMPAAAGDRAGCRAVVDQSGGAQTSSEAPMMSAIIASTSTYSDSWPSGTAVCMRSTNDATSSGRNCTSASPAGEQSSTTRVASPRSSRHDQTWTSPSPVGSTRPPLSRSRANVQATVFSPVPKQTVTA